MNRKQAEQLEVRIQQEAPYLDTSVITVSYIGGHSWAVSITAHSSGLHLGNMESSTEWDNFKQTLQRNNRL